MIRIILRLIILVLCVSAAVYIVPGIDAESWRSIILAAVALAVLNIFIKPVLIILTLPVNILTLGLFTVVVNGFLLWLVSAVVDGFEVSGFLVSVLGALIISVLSMLLNTIVAN